MTGLNITEAVTVAKETGRKIRRAAWSDVYFAIGLCLGNGKYYTNDHHDDPYEFLQEDFEADDWEIYYDQSKTMGFVEMVGLIKCGGKATRLQWRDETMILRIDNRNHLNIFGHGVCAGSSLVEDIEATDWIIVKEEQP